MSAPGTPRPALGPDTVEAAVRAQMATALGGRRGMVEAGVPGALFTVLWLATKDVPLALVVSLVVTLVLLAVRLVQRSTVQFCLNALVAIAIGYLFVRLAAASGGDESEQALAFFLPGILISTAYTVLMAASCLTGWPFVGFLLGSVTGDPTAWHADRQVVSLCTRLTWLFLLPGAVGAGLQGPCGWPAGAACSTSTWPCWCWACCGWVCGWPLRILSWSSMIWVLTRDRTPVEQAT